MESFQDFLLTEVADYEAYLKKYANSKSKKKLMTRTDFNTWKKHNEYWKSLPKKNGIVTGPAPDKAKKKVAEEVVSEAAQIGVGSKVYHPIHGSGKVLKHSTGAGADHWAEVKFLSGNTKRVNRKHLKLEEVVTEGMDYSVIVKHTKDGKTTDHEYTVKNANDKRHAKNIALQRHEKKIGGLKDSEQISASSNHVKELRKEEVHIHEALDPSEIAGNPKMYDAATVKKAFYHKNASESDKQSLARHLDRHHGNKEWRKSVKEETELCPKCGMNPCQCDGFAEQKETNMSISFKDFVNMLEEAKCKMKEAEEIETSDYKTDKNGRKHRAHKIVFNKGENKQEKDDEDDMKEELKGNQHKLDKNKNGKLDAHDFKLLRKEEVEQLEEDFVEILEAYDPEDYKAGHEKSQFKDGYRATLTHKKTGKVSYVGGTAYKSKEHAEGEAEVYRKHYSVGSGKATPGANYRHDRAVSDYRKKAKEAGHIAEAKFDALKLDEAETIKKDGVTRHKGDYGTSYDGDDNKKPAPTVKRGRGRPKKGSDETGEVKKFDFSALIQKHKIPKFTGKSTVHKMKD